ncbi:MAG: hypothetical protein JWN83_1574 [Chitinophagaceae bacterium]|nr:hypothetical protein [Chitinophagaceae bacterium]
MSYLFFFIYLGLFCWLLTKIKFITDTGIDKRVIVILFLVRIIAGVINGYVNLYHYTGTDIAFFHQEGITEYHLLFNDPVEYFTNIFKYHNQNSGLLDITDSFWNNLRSVLMVKLLSIFNIFSRGNFFINSIFYNFLIFFGSVSFYRIFIRIFPNKEIWLTLILFFLPSLIYFTAGTHKDGLIFLGLGISCYNLFFLIKKGFSIPKIVWLLTGLTIIFLLRNFVLITLLPAITAWIIAEKNKKFTLQTFIAVYLFFILLFFGVGKLHPALDLPQYVSTRQIAFVQISKASQSAVNINPLFPNFRSFLNNSPQALNHALMRPYLTEKFTLPYIPAAIEIFIYQGLFFLFLLFRSKNRSGPFIYFSVFFGLSMFLMIGYTIPIIGAIVRYRSIYFPFLIIPIVCSTDWGKVKRLLHFKK